MRFLEGGGFKLLMYNNNDNLKQVEDDLKYYKKIDTTKGIQLAYAHNYVSALKQLTDVNQITNPEYTYTCSGPSHIPVWECHLKVQTNEYDITRRSTFHSYAMGQNKPQTTQQAAAQLWNKIEQYNLVFDQHELNYITHEIGRASIIERSHVHQQQIDLGRVIQYFLKNSTVSDLAMFLSLEPEDANQWISTLFKEGGFNPYGNQQTSITITYPKYVTNIDETITGTLYIQTETTEMLTSTQNTITEVVTDLVFQISNIVQVYLTPPVKRDFFQELRQIKLPVSLNHPLSWLWLDSNPQRRFKKEFMEGSFNPYGNGMILTKAQYMKVNMKAFQKLTPKQKEQKWRSYVLRQKRNQTITKVKKISQKDSFSGPSSRQNRDEIGSKRPIRTTRPSNASIKILSQCARKYAIALYNPFALLDSSHANYLSAVGLNLSMAEGPCIPTTPALKSRRLKIFCRGTMSTMSNGIGYIAFAPRRLGNNYPLTSDTAAPVLYSLSGSGPTTGFPPMDGYLGYGGGAINWNSDYSTGQLVIPGGLLLGITYRVVGAGIRLRYIGNELNRAGVIHAIEEPNHASLSNLQPTQLQQFESYFDCAVTREWSQLTYTPVSEVEFAYLPDLLSNPAGSYPAETFQHSIGFLVEGTAPASPFQFEAIMLAEVVGSQVRDLKEAESDSQGRDAVLNSISPTKQKQMNDQGLSGMMTSLQSGIKDVTGLVQTGSSLMALM